MTDIAKEMIEAAKAKGRELAGDQPGALVEAMADIAAAGAIAALSRPIDPKAKVEPVAWQPRYKKEVIDHLRTISDSVSEYAMTVFPSKSKAEDYGYGGHEVRALYASPSIVAPVGVKALVWKDEKRCSTANSLIGVYVVDAYAQNWTMFTPEAGADEDERAPSSFHDTRDAAKDAAQADYSSRILSALYPSEVSQSWEGFLNELETWCCELPDRTSPDDAPEMMLIDRYELEMLAEKVREFCALTPAEKAGVGDGDGTAAQIEWLKARLADLQLPAGKRDHDTREKWLLQCGMPDAALSTTKPAQGEVDAAANFLVNRLKEFERKIDDFDDEREFQGHVVPAIARLVAALAAQGDDAQEERK